MNARHAGRPWMKELTAFLLKHAPEDKKGPLQSVLTGNKAADTVRCSCSGLQCSVFFLANLL